MEFVLKHLLLVNMGGRSDLLVVTNENQWNSPSYSFPKLFSDCEYPVSSYEEKVVPYYLYIFALLPL